jgi:hypothetical protein
LLWYVVANARCRPEGATSQRRPPAASTIEPSRFGPTRSIGPDAWMYGVQWASGRARGALAIELPQPQRTTAATTQAMAQRFIAMQSVPTRTG